MYIYKSILDSISMHSTDEKELDIFIFNEIWRVLFSLFIVIQIQCMYVCKHMYNLNTNSTLI